MKTIQRLLCQGVAAIDQRVQGIEAVGHVGCVLERLQGFAGPQRVSRLHGGQAQVVQSHPGQSAPPAGQRIRTVGSVVAMGLIDPLPIRVQGTRQLQAHGLAHDMNGLGIHLIELLGDVAL